ncbi:SRPBCC family protein [Streptomyces sp. MK5]|uniref:SRPBCC family protein n=1 Tax=Streptomyces sp. MK5 TaxID=3064253 RepID=UPI0027403643|nr:SRPBCC family protein [Streptomyces sp. MK5]
MSSQRVHAAEHAVGVAAPAGVVYGLLADAVRWPVLFPSYVHVERMDHDGTQERLHLWDLVQGRVRPLRVRRRLHPRTRTVATERIDPVTPGVVTSGLWRVTPDGDRCVLSLRREHDPPPWFGSSPETDDSALEAEVVTRLDEVKAVAERWTALDQLLLGFEDSIRVSGPHELVYDFFHRIEDWPELVPHIDWVDVEEDVPGVQVADLGSCDWDGAGAVVSRAVRLCFPSAGRVVHKDLLATDPDGAQERPGLSRLLAGHTTEWSVLPGPLGTIVVCSHSAMLKEAALDSALGSDATLVDARHEVRAGLGRASREVLGLAKWHAESALRRVG